MLRFFFLRKFGMVFTEYLMLSGIIFGALAFCLPVSFLEHPSAGPIALKALLMAMIFQICLHLSDAHNYQKMRLPSAAIAHVAKALIPAALTLWALHLLLPGILEKGETLLCILLASAVFLLVWHALWCLYFKIRAPRSHILLLGTGQLARDLVREIIRRPELGIGVSGFLGDDPELVGVSIVNPKVIGLYKDLRHIVASRKVNQIVVELQDRRGLLPIEELLKLKTTCIRIEEAASLYERITGKIAVENLKPSWMIFNPGFSMSLRHAVAKQTLSVLLALLALVILAPASLLIMVLIKLDSSGPIFFAQERIGRDGRSFTLWKFRTMRPDAERATGTAWAKNDDVRITRFGRLLRRSRLDSVPTLYNVLHGDMSLIGPRPEQPMFANELLKKNPYYVIRHLVRPGLTGWAQIHCRHASSIEDSVEKLQYDLFYIKHMSIVLDVWIAFETLKTILIRPKP